MNENAANGASDEIVSLNVGGHVFQTTKTTLTANGPNFFTGMFSGW